MSLPEDPLEVLTYLGRLHDADKPLLEAYDTYYELEQPLSYMHPEIFREVSDRIQPVLIAWPQLIVDTVEERLDIEGFQLPEQDTGDDDLWRVWQANDLDEESQLGHVDALAMGRSYACVGTDEDDADTPLVTVESPLEVFAHIDPRTREVDAALRRWCDTDSIVRQTGDYATLYLPDATISYDRANGWREIGRDEHRLGVVPVVPIVNRARLSSRRARLLSTTGRTAAAVTLTRHLGGRYGRSELEAVLPLSDAACKIATDMMIAAEFHAIPMRAIFGIGPDDLVDVDGNRLSKMQAVMGRLFTTLDTDGKAFQFDASSLTNYHETLNQLARLVASIAGLPPHYLGFTTDNPASADAIRSAESRLVKRAERKQRAFGGSWEQTMRVVRRFQDPGTQDPRLRRMETRWRDAATPTIAQVADATVKKHAEGIIDTEQAQEDLGYTDGQRQRMRQRREANQINLGIGSLEQFANGAQPPAAPPPAPPAPPAPGAPPSTPAPTS